MRLRGRALAAGAALVLAILLAAAGEAQQGPAKARPGAPPSRPSAAGDKASDDKNAPVTVDADSLESLQKEGLAVFKGNVVARQNNSVQYAERMEVYTDAKTSRVERVISTGNVRIITRDCRMGSAARAEYYDAEQRVVLIGKDGSWRSQLPMTAGQREIGGMAGGARPVDGALPRDGGTAGPSRGSRKRMLDHPEPSRSP